MQLRFLSLFFLPLPLRYLDSVTNKDSTLPPIPHLHSLLSDDVEPYPEVDIFRLIRSSYEVGGVGFLNSSLPTHTSSALQRNWILYSLALLGTERASKKYRLVSEV